LFRSGASVAHNSTFTVKRIRGRFKHEAINAFWMLNRQKSRRYRDDFHHDDQSEVT
jgi:hypothetical protein